MNWDRIEGDWKQFKGKVKQKWGQLTDGYLAKINGKREQQERYGSARDKAKAEIEKWANDLK